MDGVGVSDDGAYADGAIATGAASNVYVEGSAEESRPIDAGGARVELPVEKALPVREGQDVGSNPLGVSRGGQLGGGHGLGDAVSTRRTTSCA